MELEQPQQELKFQANLRDYLTRQNFNDPRNTIINLDSLRKTNSNMAQAIIQHPLQYYPIIKKYIESLIRSGQESNRSYDAKIQHFNIGFMGNLGENFVTPRGLKSTLTNQIVGIQGLVTKMEKPKSFLEKSVQWCDNTKSYTIKQYPDQFKLGQAQQIKSRYIRSFDQNQNPLQFQYGLSSFRDLQKATIQELPEMAPPGQLPMSVPIILQNSLCNKVKPGDRVEAIGVYVIIPSNRTMFTGIFDRYFLCLSIKFFEQKITLRKIKSSDFPKPQDRYRVCANSIAPSIFGHQLIKKALLLMLVGGNQKQIKQTHLRGDINVLFIGDPGTAKSQLLRYVLNNFQRAVGTTGSGASGVGLTAAITTDATGEKAIQAGAMVLADRGIVCIDQFDKMNQGDRVAIHQAMEQQTVTINKAGIFCSLNARCSVLAAANPIYGQFQQNMTLDKNIGMPDTLLSRFDLVFVIRDTKQREKDQLIASKVVQNHKIGTIMQQQNFTSLNFQSYVVTPIENQSIQQNIFEKTYKKTQKHSLLTQKALKDYIYQCKQNRPLLNEQSSLLISQMFTFLRNSYDKGVFSKISTIQILPITTRNCETLIRLSQAHAKVRQSSVVEIKDCVEAFRLISFAMTGDTQTFEEDLIHMIQKAQLKQQKQLKSQPKKKRQTHQKITVVTDSKPTKKIEVLSKIDIKNPSDQAQKLLQNLSLAQKRKLKSVIYSEISKQTQRSRSQGKFKVSTLISTLLKKDPSLSQVAIRSSLSQLEVDNKILLDGINDEQYIYVT